MNTKQENFYRRSRRCAIKALFIQSGGQRCGLPDDMRTAINWRETLKKMGYVPFFG